MLIAKGRLSHVAELDGALAATVHEEIAVYRVEFGGGDDLSQLLHVDWLDIDNV